MNIFVGNLPFSTTEDQLRDEFGAFGEVSSVKIIVDRETGRSRGFGFVEMPSDQEGQTAVQELDQKDFGGRQIRVSEARPRQDRR
jgi:RNA recognition motif-containing protein